MQHSSNTVPDALLLVAPGCPHCPINLEGLSTLVKEGVIGRLEVVNIAAREEPAHSLGVRSVPWTRIGSFDLEGRLSPAELREWAQRAGSVEGMAAYFEELLKTGKMGRVGAKVREEPSRLLALVHLLRDPETGVHVRVGIAAVLEDLQGTGIAAEVVPELGELAKDDNPRIRQDACHYLALTEAPSAVEWLQACLQDQDPEVREAAREGIEALG